MTTLFVAAVCVLVSPLFRLFETDMWQHLLVGKAIWQLRSVPTTQLWTWPTYGAPDVNASWGFEALLWPFWRLGGVWGLTVWRLLTVSATFALLWATARRMGARGLGPLVVVVLCSIVYRPRMTIRPESLMGVLLALELWVLESRRQGAADRSAWLPVIIGAWANVHISYLFGIAVAGIYLLEQIARPSRPGTAGVAAPSVGRLLLAALASIAATFLNPFGWRAVWQPFEYFAHQRGEPILQTIGELQPVDWNDLARPGLPLIVLGWFVLLLWRWRRSGFDLAETLLYAGVTTLALTARRFVGVYALVAVPFLSRDLDAWLGARPVRWTVAPWARATLTGAACVLLGLSEWSRPFPRFGLDVEPLSVPERACDFIADHGVRGRAFNHFHFGGYMLWRFWPERERLPFIDIHQAGTREDRDLYAFALVDWRAWDRLDRGRHFDYALLARTQVKDDHLLDWLDADSTWALVFADDAAALYVKHGGALEPVAREFGFHDFGASSARNLRVGMACAADTALRRRGILEQERQIRSSPRNAIARSLLANLLLLDPRPAAARDQLEQALKIDPSIGRAWERLGLIALGESDPVRALRAFENEQSIKGPSSMLDLHMGQAWAQRGDLVKAEAAYRRALRRDPNNRNAWDALQGIPSQGGDRR